MRTVNVEKKRRANGIYKRSHSPFENVHTVKTNKVILWMASDFYFNMEVEEEKLIFNLE